MTMENGTDYQIVSPFMDDFPIETSVHRYFPLPCLMTPEAISRSSPIGVLALEGEEVSLVAGGQVRS